MSTYFSLLVPGHARLSLATVRIVVMWIALVAPVTWAAAEPHCRPGAEVKRAFVYLGLGKMTKACDAFLAAVQAGTDDPWGYSGITACIADSEQGPRIGSALQQALLRQQSDHPAFVAMVRGYHQAYQEDDFQAAERSLREALVLAPGLALVRFNLALFLMDRGDVAEAIPLFEETLRQCPELPTARRSLDRARLRLSLQVGVWQRILVRLGELPDRWNTLPSPVVASSGRTADQVIDAADKAERKAAMALLAGLAYAPLDERKRILAEEQAERPLSEVDLWVPIRAAANAQRRDMTETGLVVEAWLELAENLGRRDILMMAAGFSLAYMACSLPPIQLQPVALKWTALPPVPDGAGAAAFVAHAHGQIQFRLGQNAAALSTYRKSRSMYRALGDVEGEADAWSSEGEVLFRLGQNAAALSAYRQGRSLYQASGPKLGQANTWLLEGDLLALLGQHERALSAYRNSRQLYRSVDIKQGEANTWHAEARVLADLQQVESALRAYRESRRLYRAVDLTQGEANSWIGEAMILSRLKQNDGALRAYREARRISRAVGETQGEANSWIGEAAVLFRSGQHRDALRAARRGMPLVDAMHHVPSVIRHRMLTAVILDSLGQEPRALHAAEEARVFLERWRAQGTADLDRTSMIDDSSPYDFMVPRLARRRGGVGRALELAEAAHAPVFRDLLGTAVRQPAGTSNAVLAAERARLQQERVNLGEELARTNDPGRRSKLEVQRRHLDEELELVELQALGLLDSPLVSAPAIDAATRRALVDAAGTVLLYYVAYEQTVMFLLRPGAGRPKVHIAPSLSWSVLDTEVRALRHELGNPPWQARAQGRQRALFDQLIGPLAGPLAGVSRLVIIPHGPLHELPFEALLDPAGEPLFARWHVSVVPSLSALHMLRERQARRTHDGSEIPFLGMASGTGLTLPRQEIHGIAALLGSAKEAVLPDDSEFETYVAQAPRARHLLITTHGRHGAMSRSGYLEIASSPNHDGRLLAAEIANIELRANLVTLAACETARGEAMLNDERLDLTRAFLIAGADAVLATRWKVPEGESTWRFLLDFYQALRQGGPGDTPLRKDEALTTARRRARARGDDAQLWAAWVLVGDAR